MKRIIIFILVTILLCINVGAESPNLGLPQTLKRMHFVIYHNDRHAANEISWKAEFYYKQIVRHFNIRGFRPWQGKEKCTIYLFEDKKDYIQKAEAPRWSGGLARYNPPRLYIYEENPRLIKQILPHELTHLLFAQFMPREKIPLWLNEGMAQYEEERWYSTQMKSYLKEQIKNENYIKPAELFRMKRYPQDKTELVLFYLESASIIEYLKDEQLATAFADFLIAVKQDYSIEEALEHAYQWKFDEGISEFEKKWLKFVKTRY